MAGALAVGVHYIVRKQEWHPLPISLRNNVTTCGLKQHEKRRGDIKWAPRNSERAQRAFRINTRKSLGIKPVPQKRLVKTVVQTLVESIHKRHWQNALKVSHKLVSQAAMSLVCSFN
ncbi:hypothetical protein SUGI_0835070 [Cryptomeria japonica]|nr:hypothetical protein SUGI_0835070 [Cryptomeria japonica]